MKTVGIVAEYNPFHNGHKFHIEKTKEKTNCDFIIAVMSGNFVQRGEPAIVDKWSRTKSALLNGVDLVIELPTIFSTSTAEIFAQSSVKLLNDMGIINYISFGSESGDIENLQQTSNLIKQESEEFKSLIKHELSLGKSFPSARQEALENITGTSQSIISSSNNILATEYLKALNNLGSTIEPVTIKRIGQDYNSIKLTEKFSSATAIRKSVFKNNLELIKSNMPYYSHKILLESLAEGKAPIELNSFSHQLNYALRSNSLNEIKEILDISEGLENRIINSLNNGCYTVDEILSFIKTKRYTYTRLQRALLHILLDIKTHDLKYLKNNGFCPYIRVLGFKKSSQVLLSELVKKSSLPVITSFKDIHDLKDKSSEILLKTENKATNIYFMACPYYEFRSLNKEYTNPVVIV